MKETAAKRRDKAGGRDRDKSNKEPKEPKEVKPAMAAAEPQDVEMPEEETTNAVKLPKEQDSLTLEGNPGSDVRVEPGEPVRY